MRTIQNAIDGQKVTSSSRRMAPVYNPATGDQTAELALSTVDEVNSAVAAAKEAAVAWGTTTPLKRIKHMFRFKELLDRHADEIARTISNEHGKTHADALGEVARGIDIIDFACGISHLLKGEYSRNVGPEIDSWSDRQPLGVVAGITPFNFPAMVPMWMYPVAVACGNTFILKPSERDPSTSMLIWDLFHDAGFPPGVFNVVHGDKQAVDAILDHSDIKAVSFVGSTPVAEYIYARGAATGKRVQALGGAKNHMIVMPDADMDQAVDALMGAGFGSAGERCMAISVAVPVGEKTGDRLVEALAPKIRAMKVGPASDPESEMGPVITAEAKQRIEGLIGLGVKEGAELVVDGRGLKLQGYERGFFLGGSLFDRVTKDMTIYKTEILSVVRTGGFEEAADLVNSHEYGNGTAIFTRDGRYSPRFCRSHRNRHGRHQRADPGSGRLSLLRRLEAVPLRRYIYGPEGVRFYTRLKTVTARWPTGIRSGTESISRP
jgi:malonate-semialdehyde dehydrogenase (acetylating)/methylmalonate-semialdehyde dehydrogenase